MCRERMQRARWRKCACRQWISIHVQSRVHTGESRWQKQLVYRRKYALGTLLCSVQGGVQEVEQEGEEVVIAAVVLEVS